MYRARPIQSQACKLTVDNNSRCSAPSFGHYVLSHACVVGRVRQTCLFDDQVVVDCDVEVSVLCWVDYLFVLPPLHLGGTERRESEVSVQVSLHLWYGL